MLDTQAQRRQIILQQVLQLQVAIVKLLLYLTFVTTDYAIIQQPDQQFAEFVFAELFACQFLFQ